MLRPREGRDLRLLSHEVSTTPQAQISWATDVFGNAVATAVFSEMTDILTVDSVAIGRPHRCRMAGLCYRRLRHYPFHSAIRMRNGPISAR